MTIAADAPQGVIARAGLTMRPEQLLIFGNPKGGTPLMVEETPSAPVGGRLS